MIRYKLLIFLLVLTLPSVGQDDASMIFRKATNQFLTTNMEISVNVEETDTRGRNKEKSYEVLMGKFGEVEKTMMTMQKPERAKGITIIYTHLPDEVGIIEVYTPANGKTRKMKATEENMARVGSNLALSNFAASDHDDLSFVLLGKQQIDSISCYQLEATERSDSVNFTAEFWIEENTYHIVKIVSFDQYGKQTRITRFSDFQPIDGLKNKIQPMLILAEDIENKMQTRMQVLNILPRTDLKEEDFSIQGTIE